MNYQLAWLCHELSLALPVLVLAWDRFKGHPSFALELCSELVVDKGYRQLVRGIQYARPYSFSTTEWNE